MSLEPLVSIVMPVKNTAPFLEECLDSILAQTYLNWELIAVDDHSTDISFQIITKYAKLDKRVNVYSNRQWGIIAALKMAYKYSKGIFITRMDSDDLMSPNKIALMVGALTTKGAGFLAVGLVKYFSESTLREGYINYANWLNNLTCCSSNFSEIYKECTIPSPCWMIARTDFEACGGFNSEVYPEDYELAFRFKKGGLKIAHVTEVIHYWRDYEYRTSRTDPNYADNRFTELKVMHFLDQDYDSSLSLVLWGAGKKGKRVAQLLVENQVRFQWVSNNANKIGRDIYGIILQNMLALVQLTNAQVIIALSSPNDMDEIKKLTKSNPTQHYYKFY